MVTPIQLDAQGHLSLPPEVLAEAGFSRNTKLECEVHEGRIVLRKGPTTLSPEQVREGIRRFQEASKGYRFTTEEVMQMTRGED